MGVALTTAAGGSDWPQKGTRGGPRQARFHSWGPMGLQPQRACPSSSGACV